MTENEQNIEVMKDIRNKLDAVLTEHPTKDHVPDPKKHLYISLAKSVIRIAAGAALILGFPLWCGIGIVAAEVLGIAEELV